MSSNYPGRCYCWICVELWLTGRVTVTREIGIEEAKELYPEKSNRATMERIEKAIAEACPNCIDIYRYGQNAILQASWEVNHEQS